MGRRCGIPLWTTKGPTGLLHWSSTGLHISKREAIAHLSRRVKTPWRKLYAEGYRVVPVVLTEVPAPRGGKGGA